MIEKIEDDLITIYPHAQEDSSGRMLTGMGHVYVVTNKNLETAGRLYLNVYYQMGMTREKWEELKRAGDRAFELVDS